VHAGGQSQQENRLAGPQVIICSTCAPTVECRRVSITLACTLLSLSLVLIRRIPIIVDGVKFAVD